MCCWKTAAPLIRPPSPRAPPPLLLFILYPLRIALHLCYVFRNKLAICQSSISTSAIIPSLLALAVYLFPSHLSLSRPSCLVAHPLCSASFLSTLRSFRILPNYDVLTAPRRVALDSPPLPLERIHLAKSQVLAGPVVRLAARRCRCRSSLYCGYEVGGPLSRSRRDHLPDFIMYSFASASSLTTVVCVREAYFNRLVSSI